MFMAAGDDDNSAAERGRGMAGPLVVGALALLLIGYVPSVGPAVWLHDRGCLPDAVGLLYIPLEWVYEHCEPIKPALDWYVGLFAKKTP